MPTRVHTVLVGGRFGNPGVTLCKKREATLLTDNDHNSEAIQRSMNRSNSATDTNSSNDEMSDGKTFIG